jgi:hypothetical protein
MMDAGMSSPSPDALSTATGSPRDSWSRRHATLTAWKATRTLHQALGELRHALDDDSAMDSEVRGWLTHASDATEEALSSLDSLQRYLRADPAPTPEPEAVEDAEGAEDQGAMVEPVTRGAPSPR